MLLNNLGLCVLFDLPGYNVILGKKDAYFVIKVNKSDVYLERYPELEVVMEKDGYVFAVRRAAPSGP